MALSDLFEDEAAEPVAVTPPKKVKPQPVDLLAGSEARVSEAQQIYEKCEAVFAALVRRAVKGENLGAEIDAAEDKRFAAEKALKLAQRMAEAAKAEAKEQAIKAKRERMAADWSKAITLADARAKALKSLSQTIKAFAEDWIEVKRLNEELYGALPARLDLDGAKMRLHAVADLIRKEMSRQGVEWADDTPPSILISLRPFDEIMAETPSVIRGWRDQLTATPDETEH